MPRKTQVTVQQQARPTHSNKPKADPAPSEIPLSLEAILSRLDQLEKSDVQQGQTIRALENTIQDLRESDVQQGQTTLAHENTIQDLQESHVQQGQTIRAHENAIQNLQESDARQGRAIRAHENTIQDLQESDARQDWAICGLQQRQQTMMQAIAGDRVAINAIRIRVLLDHGRDHLARLCGYTNWDDLELKIPSDSLRDLVHKVLNTSKDPNWKAIGRKPEVLNMLLEPSTLRRDGNTAAHASTQELIPHGVLAMSVNWERAVMTTIFRAVYGIEPDANF
ncbi:hypothetical protein BS47DRAFT_1342880 [Hydnum rufescens UP504]|uniref:Uncharacterized protein n=1 Tax=Hydnum rufescens UP504 TaxID=1448309 RepID=A0A9P6AYX7_9AGAM|nr:hypothetical protein BS47DRAFT_1342880 [Hydnum rufescens UP504]